MPLEEGKFKSKANQGFRTVVPATWEAEAGGLESQGLQSKSKASLGESVTPCVEIGAYGACAKP